MKKTPLEALLEEGLQAMNKSLGRRVYYEEIMVGSDIDDEHGNDTVENYPKTDDEGWLRNPGLNLSSYQQDVADGHVPFYRRSAETPSGLILDYEVFSSEKLSSYDQHADRIINEGKISAESIVFYDGRNGWIARIDISHAENTVTAFLCDDTDSSLERLDIQEYDRMARLNGIENLRGSSYVPEMVYKEVMHFIDSPSN